MKKLLLSIIYLFCLLLSSHSFAQCRAVHILSAATNNATSFTTQQGPMGLCGPIVVTNTTNTTGMDLRIYDSSGTPVCSSATGVKFNIAIPTNATTAAAVGGFAIPINEHIGFQFGIGICLTGAVSDSDNSNAVTGVQVNLGVYGN
jgi:hypothetical protein